MKIVQLTVEVSESKRFDAKGRELYPSTNIIRLPGTDTVMPREKLAGSILASKEFFNLYTGDCVQMDEDDLEDIGPLTERLAADFPSEKLSEDGVFVDLVNNGGLRLAYGEKIKGRIRHARESVSIADVSVAVMAAIQGSIPGYDAAWFKAQPDKSIAGKAILAEWVRIGKPV